MASNTTARLTLFCWTAVLLDREVDSPPHPPQDRIRPVTTDSPRNLSCAGRAGRPRDASPGCARPRAQGPRTPSKTADQTLAHWARLKEGPGRRLCAVSLSLPGRRRGVGRADRDFDDFSLSLAIFHCHFFNVIGYDFSRQWRCRLAGRIKMVARRRLGSAL